MNEAYLRLVDQTGIRWQDRAHFFGIAARLIRQILVDHARRRGRAKRDPGGYLLSLDETIGTSRQSEVDLVSLDDALISLSEKDEMQGRIVELRFFVWAVDRGDC